jgi:dienelactone hydrolase
VTRWGLLAGILLVAIAQIGLHRAVASVAHEAVLLDPAVRATIYRPAAEQRRGARVPIAVLVHGWGSNRGSLRGLARSLASQGIAAISIDVAGHGASTRSFAGGSDAALSLSADIEAAVLHARLDPDIDGQRIALLGHGLGADAALEYASRDPAVSAVVALAPEHAWSGGYAPPNTLVIWGEEQRASTRRGAREIARRLASTQQIRTDREYGSIAARRCSRASSRTRAICRCSTPTRSTAACASGWCGRSDRVRSRARPRSERTERRAPP